MAIARMVQDDGATEVFDPIAPTSGGTVTGSGSTPTPTPTTSTSTPSGGAAVPSFPMSNPSTGDLYIVCAAAGVAQQGQALPLNPTDSVEIMPLDTNAGKVWFASSRSAAMHGPRAYVPASGRTWAGKNLADLWVVAEQNGEGVAITIKSR